MYGLFFDGKLNTGVIKMSDRKYLNENQHQRSVRKLSLISKIMMINCNVSIFECVGGA